MYEKLFYILYTIVEAVLLVFSEFLVEETYHS